MDYKEVLKNYGNDVDGTLNRFCGNENLYKKFIRIFFERENPEKIREQYKNKEYDELLMAAHTYKGITGNLGLTKLFEMFGEIVDKIRRKDYETIREMIEKVLEEKEKLERALKESEGLGL
ncbi:Hpt domain-containing protein [Fusobacterium sp. THCT1E2]